MFLIFFLVPACSTTCRRTKATNGYDGHGQHKNKWTNQSRDTKSEGML